MRVFLIASLLLALVACDRRVEKWVDAEDEPPRPERPVRVPGLERPVPRARVSPPEPAALPEPGGGGAPAAGGGAPRGDPIRGTLKLAPGVEVPGGAIVFVIARSPGGGPPLAALRLAAGVFPMSFEIGPRNVMIQGRRFVGPITLSARVDSDGDPLTRDPSDPSATHRSSVEPGASGVELELRPQG